LKERKDNKLDNDGGVDKNGNGIKLVQDTVDPQEKMY